LAGEAICDLRFLPGSRQSPEFFREVAQVLHAEMPREIENGPEGTIHTFTSVDGLWTLAIEPSRATLKTQALRGPEEFLGRVFQVTDLIHNFLKTVLYETVRLRYLKAVPVGDVEIPHLFSDWASFLNENAWERQSEFAQTISRVEHGIQYLLRYGIRPVGQEPFYLSDASVSESAVEAERLQEVLSNLESEGLRLLSLPIAKQALTSLQEIEHSKPQQRSGSFHVSELINDLLRSSPELEAIAFSANAERLRLITRKHEGGSYTLDDQRRLEELTEKVRALIPRVTAADWELARELQSRIDRTEDHTDQIRRKYSLLR
jgi:uncharacterized protein (TIGR04255 family)